MCVSQGSQEFWGVQFRALLIPKSSKFHRLTKKCSSQDNGFFETSFIQLVFLEFLLNTSSTTLGVFEVSSHEIKLETNIECVCVCAQLLSLAIIK